LLHRLIAWLKCTMPCVERTQYLAVQEADPSLLDTFLSADGERRLIISVRGILYGHPVLRQAPKLADCEDSITKEAAYQLPLVISDGGDIIEFTFEPIKSFEAGRIIGWLSSDETSAEKVELVYSGSPLTELIYAPVNANR
jgi:hypothetical protein